jgi:DNA-binding IclR family transcriptional regulator
MQAQVKTRFVLRCEEGNTYAPPIKLQEFGSAVWAKLDLSLQAERLIKAMMALMQALTTVARRETSPSRSPCPTGMRCTTIPKSG